MTLTSPEICQKNYTDLTLEEFDKVFNIEGFCDPPSNVTNTNVTDTNTSYQHAAILVYYPFLIFCGTILNTTVILTILRIQRLRTITNVFMISLSIADFLMASIAVPLRLSEFLRFDKSNYVITDMLFPLIGIASIFSLCSVTLDRYIHIQNALNYDTYMNKFRAMLLVTAIWIFAIFQAIIVPFMADRAKEMIYNDVRFILCFCVPGFFIAIAYVKLFLVARRHAHAIAMTTPAHSTNTRSSYKKDSKIFKMVALMVGTFFFCWFPFFLLVSYDLHDEMSAQTSSVFRAFLQISECLACSTCVLNPLLYAFLRRDLRLSIRNAITCKSSSLGETTGTS